MTGREQSRRVLDTKLVLVLAVALLVRLLYLFEQGATSVLFYQPLLDELELANTAKDLLAGKGLGSEPLFKAPLYPVVLAGVMAVFGSSWFWGIRLLQHLTGVWLVFLAWKSARLILPAGRGRDWAGTCAAWLVALYGPLIRLEECVVLDGLVVCLQSTMLYGFMCISVYAKTRRVGGLVCLAGALAALSWLTRPTITPVLPVLALWLVFRTRSVRYAALFLIFPLVAAGALAARNYAVSGEALWLPWQGGYSFYEANRRGTNGRYFVQSQYAYSQSGNPTQSLAVNGYLAHVGLTGSKVSYGAVSNYWFDKSMADIKLDPADWLKRLAGKARDLTTDREIFNYEDYEVQRELSLVLKYMPISFGIIFPFTLAAITLLPAWPRSRKPAVQLGWLYAVFLGGAVALYYTSGRFRMPLMFPAVVIGMSGIFQLVVGGRCAYRTRAAYGILFLAGCFLSWGDWAGVRSESHRAIEYARLSNAAYLELRYAEALAFADEAAAAEPAYPTLALLRGQALYALGRKPEARDEFARSLLILPKDPVAPYNLGVMQYYMENNTTAALASFAEAQKRQPSYQRAALMRVLTLIRGGSIDEARETFSRHGKPADGVGSLWLTVMAALECASGDRENAQRIVESVRQEFGEAGVDELVLNVRLAVSKLCL